MIRRLCLLLLLSTLMVAVAGSGTATAGPLDDAKRAGQIGEQANGYVGVVSGNAPAGVRQLVDEINLKRRAEYRSLAQRNGTSLQAVEALVGKKLVERAPGGQFVRMPNGRWARK